MTKNEAIEIVAVLAATYPNVVGRMDRDQARAWAESYVAGIRDLDFGQAKAAVDRLIKSSEWLSIAAIRSAVLVTTRGQARSGAEAWGDVKRAVSRYGIYRDAKFDDPIVARVVAGLGWRELCNSENETADRARFVDAYNELTKQGRTEAQVSPGAAAPALPSRGPAAELVAGVAKKLGVAHVHRFVNDTCDCGARDD